MNATGNQTDSGYKTFQATAVAIAAYARVDIDSNGLISVAGATNSSIGITQEAIAASGYGTVRLWSAPGTFRVLAGAAVTRGAAVYPIAAGKVDDAGTTGAAIGYANEAATADGDVIEVIPNDGSSFALGDGQNIVLGGTTGTKIGTSATAQKLGFFNATPVVQPLSANQTALTDSTGGAVSDATLASMAAATTLTDSTGLSGSHNDTLEAVTTFTPSVAWNGSSVYPSAADATAIATAITALNQNASDTAQKIIELVTWQAVAQDNTAKTAELVNALRTALVNLGIIKGSA